MFCEAENRGIKIPCCETHIKRSPQRANVTTYQCVRDVKCAVITDVIPRLIWQITGLRQIKLISDTILSDSIPSNY